MGITDAEWRRLTPRLLVARIERHAQIEALKNKAENLRTGIIAAEIRNTMRSKEAHRIWTAFDFFPADDAEIDDDRIRHINDRVRAQHAALRERFRQRQLERDSA